MRRSWILVVAAAIVAAGSAAMVWYRLRRSRGGHGRLDDLSKDELYDRAKAADIPGRSEMNKDELIQALRSRS